MNFAIMYDTNDGRIIKTFDELSEAQYAAQNVACMGFSVTIFDYDIEAKQYIEFYTI